MSRKRSSPAEHTGRMEIGGLCVHLPIGQVNVHPRKLAPRIPSLGAARIGILDNSKEYADLVLTGVSDTLASMYPSATIKTWRKDYLGVPSPFAQEMASQCDVVINGVGH